MYMNIFDSHTHSDNSHDGKHSVLYMSESAEKKQLMGFCVTDHFECNLPQNKDAIRIRNSVMEVAKAKSAYEKRLVLTTGVEIGQATQDFDLAEKLINQSKFDFVLGSLHNDKGMDDYYYVDFTGLNVEMILDRYYDEVLELCRWNKFDVLAHLTYPLRYITGKYQIHVDMSRYDPIIRDIMFTLAQNGKGIEINTSGLRQELGETLPTIKYVRMFKECKGEIVTLGSDAHCAQDLGENIQEAMAMLESAGFKYFAFYKKREPRMLHIM